MKCRQVRQPSQAEFSDRAADHVYGRPVNAMTGRRSVANSRVLGLIEDAAVLDGALAEQALEVEAGLLKDAARGGVVGEGQGEEAGQLRGGEGVIDDGAE